MSFGNTIKRPEDVRYAHENSVDTFAIDASGELAKVTERPRRYRDGQTSHYLQGCPLAIE